MRAATAAADEDHRAWQHGIDLLRVGQRLLLIWGSAGNPPRPNLGGDWPHDIYYDWLTPGDGGDDIAVTPHVLVSRPEAQEPPSAAINSRGVILVTAEDGEDEINQRAGLWDAGLAPLRPYPFTIRRGGHSGHAAALGERFLVVYGEGWQDGGGFMNRGTGRNIHAKIVDGAGRPGVEINLTHGQRDGWPVVAASDRNWLVLWQRYAGLGLHSSTVDIKGKVGQPRLIADGLPLRYAYDVTYVSMIERYLVAGNRGAQGFMALLDREGVIVGMQDGLPPIASESRVLTRHTSSSVIAVYPTAPNGVAVVALSGSRMTLSRLIEHPHPWDYMGTTGLFTSDSRVLFATLTMQGIRAFSVSL